MTYCLRTNPVYLGQRFTSIINRASSIRHSSTFSHLTTSLPKREIAPIFEKISSEPSFRLSTTLADFLPNATPPVFPAPSYWHKRLPIAHHLCYFEPTLPLSALLPDGTIPDQSPGEPFVRRMWAGARVQWNLNSPLRMDGSRAVCAEFIRSVTIKGNEPDERVFVEVERRLANATANEIETSTKIATAFSKGTAGAAQELTDLQHRVRQRLWRDSEENLGHCSIVETRNIVFMREKTARTPPTPSSSPNPPRPLPKPQHEPAYTHTLTPTPQLLFRFSALTFNGHAIHLDPRYAQEVEGHQNLLVHGPLSFVFIMTLLQQHLNSLESAADKHKEVITGISYRNLAPLYVGEEVTFQGARTGEGRWEVWALKGGEGGGMAVKGTVKTERRLK
jgi:hydroxyacyl-ACP dehydratase HTD2-like protein with hotdog domain